MLDSNIVAVSLPAIGRAIEAGFRDIQWVISAYVLTYSALLLAAGNYADLRGRKRAMLLGLWIFAGASLGCGLSASAWELNLARALQGVGGALLLTSSLAVLSHEFTGASRAQAFAFWGASLGTALAVGPVVGGAITDSIGWRWIFLTNIPICLALIRAVATAVPESRDVEARRLDLPGIVTFSAGLALLIWALIDGNEEGWTSASVIARIGFAASLFVLFYRVERPQSHPMVDFELFQRRPFVGAVIAMMGYGATAQVLIYFLPLHLQNALGFSALQAGIGMAPFALPMVLAPAISGRLAARFSGRVLLTIGLVTTCAGNILLSLTAWSNVTYTSLLLPMLLAGSGAGLLNGQTVRVLGNAVPPARSGMASGLASTTRFIGILISVAGLGAILSGVVAHVFLRDARVLGIASDLATVAVKKVAAGNVLQAFGAFPEGDRPQLIDIAHRAFGEGFATATGAAAMLAALAAALTYLLVRDEDNGATPRMSPGVPCKTIDCRHPL